MDMIIDKQSFDGTVCFNDKDHKYFKSDSKDDFISVTTLIHKFVQDFDEEFWSRYKALQKLAGEDNFDGKVINKNKRGPASEAKQNLLDTKKYDHKWTLHFKISIEDLEKEAEAIRQFYKEERDRSCFRGTTIHKNLENLIVSKNKMSPKVLGAGLADKISGDFNFCENTKELLPGNVYPEVLLYRISNDNILRIAGQVDVLIIDHDGGVYVVDFKGLPLDTPIATPTGWTLMKDLEVGDEVFDKNGEITKVLNVSSIHENPCYEIKFDNSESIVCDHEHKWEVSFRKGKGVYSTKVMTAIELHNFMEANPRTSYTIPKIFNAKPIQTKEIPLPIDPYIFGAWLGDGSKSCGIVTNVRREFWDEVTRRGYTFEENLSKEDKAEMRTIYEIKRHLVNLDVLNNEFIPLIYLRGSYQQRLDLLRGLMDTGGYYHPKRKRFVMNTSQEWQARDLMKLIASLGWKPTLFNVPNSCNGEKFKGWHVCFSATENPFLIRNEEISLAQKKDNSSFRNIESVKLVETVQTKCIEVDSATHTYLAGYTMIPTHNTNKKIEKKSYFNQKARKSVKMKYPLNNLDDCNFNHYQLQLSLYY
jgi:hypothetical protein